VIGEEEEALYWSTRAIDVHHDILESVRTSAAKWQAGIAAFLGAYATVGFVVGPTTLETLPVTGWIRDVILSAMCLGGLVAIAAVYSANQASTGLPKVVRNRILTGMELAKNTVDTALRAQRCLTRAIVLAGVSGFLVVASSMSVLAAGVLSAPPAPNALLVTAAGTYCGTMTTQDGKVVITLSNGTLVPASGGTLTIVTSCGNA
jgi:hypothetical protein